MRETDYLKGRLDVLPSLRALLEERSVTAAAERMRVTQPAMSRTLDQLRYLFDDPLLIRAGSRMQPTARARQLLDPVCHVLSAAGELYTAPTFDPRTESRTFRAVIPDVIAVHLLPRILDELSREAPLCRLWLEPWEHALTGSGTLDLVVTTETREVPAFRRQALFSDHDVLVLGAPRRSRRKDPLDYDHVAVIPAGLVEDPVDRWLREQGRSRRIRTVVPHYLLALQLVAHSGFAAILPSRMVASFATTLALHAYGLPLEQEPDQQWLMYPPELEAEPASRWLRTLVIDLCTD